MNNDNIYILLIEDNPADVILIREMLRQAKTKKFSIENCERLADGLTGLSKEKIHVVLLDLMLPDSEGLETFKRVISSAPHVPVIIMTGISDENIAIEAMKKGAQDYLVKGQVDSRLLTRSIYYAIERNKLEEQLRAVAITDVLTGILNRRGFFTLAEQQRKVADRAKRKMYLLYLDLNQMKKINDMHGHKAGDQALCDTAYILKKTFRESDIIARIGGDEFAVLLTEPAEPDLKNIIIEHVQTNVKAFNEKAAGNYQLSLSIGLVQYDPKHPCSLDVMLSRADEQMYEDKKRYFETGILSTLNEKITEKRRHRRFKIKGNCHAELDNSDNIAIKDISFGGICLKASQEISSDNFHTVDLYCENDKITLKSVLVPGSATKVKENNETTTAQHEIRLKFMDLSTTNIQSLESILSRFS